MEVAADGQISVIFVKRPLVVVSAGAPKPRAPKNYFREPFQADLGCPAPAGKIF
jgi:hypothetical protein